MRLYQSFRRASVALAAVFTLTGCTQRLYFPDRANTPGLSEALEGKITASWKGQATSTDGLGTERGAGSSFALDAAFAPINHLGITASYRGLNDRVVGSEKVFLPNDESVYRTALYQGYRWDGAVGYFNTFDRLGRYEIYAGGGAGELRRRGATEAQYDYTTRYMRYYVQPAVGIGNQVIVLMGGVRILAQRYNSFSAPDPQRVRYVTDALGERSIVGQAIVCAEPFINGEVGYRFLKFNLQIGSSLKLAGPRVMGAIPVYGCAGITLHFAPSFLKGFGSR